MIQWDIVNFAIKWTLAFGIHLEPNDIYHIQEATDECLDFILKYQDKPPSEINELLSEKWQSVQ